MASTVRKRARVVPGFRPCAACEEPMDLTAIYSFCNGVQCICANCYQLGFRFEADGRVVLMQEQEQAAVTRAERVASEIAYWRCRQCHASIGVLLNNVLYIAGWEVTQCTVRCSCGAYRTFVKEPARPAKGR